MIDNTYKPSSRAEKLEAFGRLLDVLDELRIKCPWDAKQTNDSLRPNTIEEVYELSDALLKDNTKDLRKELGDVLLHIAFYAKIAEEKQQFDIRDVCQALTDKLIFRHPHVFGDVSVHDADEVSQNWEQLKLKEKDGNKTVMGGVPNSLPALIKAFRVQEKAANVGFDWEERSDVWEKVNEELVELREEMENEGTQERKEEELGDFLFSLINMGRLYGLEPDTALERSNQKFIRRFNFLEKRAKEDGHALSNLTLDQMEAYYQEAKRAEKTDHAE